MRLKSRGAAVLAVAATVLSAITGIGAVSAAGTDEPAPLPQASIRHADDGAHTTVRVWSVGDPETERLREGRSYRHSALQPASRFVERGEEVTVTVPPGAPDLRVGIGLNGNYRLWNEGSHVGVREVPLSTGTTTVTAPVDGLVYLIDRASTGTSVDVDVSGGVAVPAFVLGQTTDDEFSAARDRQPDAPFLTIVGQRTFTEPQHRSFAAVPRAITERVELWDRVVSLTNAHFGLLDDAVGLARKAPQRIHIAMPDSGGGYASAGNDRVTMQIDTGAAGELLTAAPGNMWGFWHEVGHTYQTSAYNWSGMGEVVVNVSALDVQHAISGENRLDRQNVADVDAFFAEPVAERRFDAENGWVKLLMFDQLRRGFGEQFYPRLNQALRTGLALGEMTTTDNGQSKRDLFAATAGEVADRDLRPFFAQWGFALSEATTASLAQHPVLERDIWENRTSTTDVLDHDLAPYAVPVGRFVGEQPSVVVGQQHLDHDAALGDLGNTDGVGTPTPGAQRVVATAPGTGTLTATLTNALGVREVISAPLRVEPGNMLLFEGLSDRPVMRLVTDPRDGVLRLYSGTSYTSHPNWGDREYVGFELRSADDREQVGSWSVRGNENANALASGFAEEYRDGQVLVVRHAEARTRLELWTDSVLQPSDARTEQRFRIVDGRFVPLGSTPVVATPGTPVTLQRNADTPVEARLMLQEQVTSISGEAVFTAPTGTTFAADQDTLRAEVLMPGGDWARQSALDVVEAAPGGAGTTLTGRFDADDLDLPGGTLVRWSPEVHVPADAAAGGSGLRYTVTGTTDGQSIQVVS